MTETPTLAVAVGRRMRSLRDEHDVTADTLAMHARSIGLGWQRSTVATIETGKRRLTGEELLLLPLLLSMALPVVIGLRDLLDTEMALTEELSMTPTGFQQLLDADTQVWGGYKLRSAGPADRKPSTEVWARIEELWPDVHGASRLNLERLRAVELAAGGETEQKAARTLGCTALEVSALSHRLWGHGLAAERERRLALVDEPTASVAVMRVRRGHITRMLVDELAAHLEQPHG
jgi:hypothetical protein